MGYIVKLLNKERCVCCETMSLVGCKTGYMCVLCPTPTGFPAGIWIPVGIVAIAGGMVGEKKSLVGGRLMSDREVVQIFARSGHRYSGASRRKASHLVSKFTSWMMDRFSWLRTMYVRRPDAARHGSEVSGNHMVWP